MAQKTFTLHLAKPDIAEFDAALSLAGQQRLGTPSATVVDDATFGGGARLYVFRSNPAVPSWFRDLQSKFDIPIGVQTRSACAALVFRADERMFAATFAHGWMYLDEESFEGDFGLRAALNALDDTKLRRLERANLADAMRGVSQSPFQREFSSFGLDDALDLVRKVNGATKEDVAADSMTGARSLKLSGEFEISDLPDLASEALLHFESVGYRDTSFQVIDVVTPVSDRRLVNTLDDLAATSIREGYDNFELGLPANYDDEEVGFKFSGPGLRGTFPDLLLRNYVAALQGRLAALSSDTLRSHKVVAVFEDGARPDQSWTIRKGLVGSLTHGGGQYATNEGEWYRVDEAFKNSIEATYQGLVRGWDVLPVPLAKHFDADGNGAYQTEASYNEERARALGYILLDTRIVRIPDVPRSGFEACDLLDCQGRRFIHVKKSSRRSNVLSHLFKQGSNAAQNFKRFPGAWDSLIEVVRAELGNALAQQVIEAHGADEPWSVEFWIADSPRVGGDFNIPFFSKISLRDEATNLTAMGYRVVVRFVGLEPEQI